MKSLCYINNFIKALEKEIEAIKCSRENHFIKIYNGIFIGKDLSGFIYKFTYDSELYSIDEIPCKIEISGQIYSAEIISSTSSELEIIIEEYIDNNIKEAVLDFKPWYLLDILRHKYIECKKNIKKFDFSLSDKIFSGHIDDANDDINCDISGDELNDAQIKAIKASYNRPLCIIWGPPGTGKTKTLAKAIEAHLKAKRRVLLVSHANNAVDEAMKEVLSIFKESDLYKEGRIIRYGKPQSKFMELYNRDYKNVLFDNVINEKFGLLIKEKEFLKKAISRIEAKFEEIERDKEYLKNINKALKEIDFSLQVLKSHLNQYAGSSDKEGYAEEIKEAIKKKELEKANLEEKSEEICEAINNNQNILKNILNKREQDIERVQLMKERITEIDNILATNSDDIISKAMLVSTTVTKTFCDEKMSNKYFDVLIIDEVSMVPLPQLYWVIARSKKYVTVAGDFLQLPPICISEDRMVKEWFGRNIFNIMKIDKVDVAYNYKLVRLLDTQYRMVPQISSIVNMFFYQNKLKDHESVMNRNLDDSIADFPLVLVDTKDVNPPCYKVSYGSRFNIYNAFVCAKIAKKILESNESIQIGIITPYSLQSRLIAKLIREWGLRENVRVSTVHRFQGGEEDVILFDASDSIGLTISPLLNDLIPDSNADLLFNVAISRAKSRFYFIGNTKYLLSQLNMSSLIYRIISYICRESTKIPAENFIKNINATDVITYCKLEARNKEEVWTKLSDDLKNVSRQIVIVCTKISLIVKVFNEIFAKIKGREVDIKVYTKPVYWDYTSKDAKVINILRDKGVTVIERTTVNKNLLIIDSVIWEGNINMFCNSGYSGTVRRYESALAVEEIIKNLELNKSNALGDVVDKPCPRCGRPMVIRKGKHRTFLGCIGYPGCDGKIFS
ncbi:AAA domain-containing protein [Caldanaerobius polysaccharolyticus]|uniref:AAA domain-containing protein n=1 Tax=Caldanaerobius polysaccharolyticus TaxID=44256 RepID=UPI000556D518|nr:AAA domain-containing protein [Caldanaerobius polysaccharolyticus]